MKDEYGTAKSDVCVDKPDNIRNRLVRLVTRSEESLERLSEICGTVPKEGQGEETLPLGTIGEVEAVLSVLEGRVSEIRRRVGSIQERI